MQQLDTTEKNAYTEKTVLILQLDKRGEEVCSIQINEVSKHCERAGSSNFWFFSVVLKSMIDFL